MSWEEGEAEKGWTRREWVRMGMGVGTFAAIAGLGGLVTGQLLPPPVRFSGEIRETITYVRWPTPQWWNSKDGQPVKVTDFELWNGATGVWRGLFQDNEWVPGTGFPVIVIRVPRNATGGTEPTSADLASQGVAPVPEGFSLAYEDLTTDTRLVVFFDRCVHLCCYPGWHVVTNPPPDYSNYVVSPPTHEVYGLDPIYCICHGSQYDPLLLTIDTNPKNSVRYVGAGRVHGPASRALPLVPVKEQGGSLLGTMPDSRWYIYC
jgi:Rieske Fe-S protein